MQYAFAHTVHATRRRPRRAAELSPYNRPGNHCDKQPCTSGKVAEGTVFKFHSDRLSRSPQSALISAALYWQVVLALAQNILKDPSDTRKRRIRINNERIKEDIMVPKGVLELVVAVCSFFESYSTDY